MSIKRLPPEARESFTMVLHPKRRYSARALHPVAIIVDDLEALLTEDGDELTTEGDVVLTLES